MVHQIPDPFVAPRGLVDYVRRIADAPDGLPIVLYLRNESIGLRTILERCAIAAVVGVKWASPTPLMLAEAIRQTQGRDLAWVGGLAETWAPPFHAVGSRGFTSGLINVFPRHSMAIHAALEAGNYPVAMGLIGAMRASRTCGHRRTTAPTSASSRRRCNLPVLTAGRCGRHRLGRCSGRPRATARIA
jgi:4-hydroxy-tetrahydrodipicolinate synthase